MSVIYLPCGSLSLFAVCVSRIFFHPRASSFSAKAFLLLSCKGSLCFRKKNVFSQIIVVVFYAQTAAQWYHSIHTEFRFFSSTENRHTDMHLNTLYIFCYNLFSILLLPLIMNDKNKKRGTIIPK